MNSKTEIAIGSEKLILTQKTDYPWSGHIEIEIGSEMPIDAQVNFRIPGWSQNEVVPSDLYTFDQTHTSRPSIGINGKNVEYTIEQGYGTLNRTWSKGDKIEIDIPMHV